MKKIKNRKLKKCLYNKEYNILLKGFKTYCVVCSRRSGDYNTFCGPSTGGQKRRQNKSWKNYRNNQYRNK